MSVIVETKGAESQVQSFSQKLLDAVKSSESLDKAINSVQAGFGKIGSAIGSAKSAFAGLNQGADKAEDSIDKLKNTIEKLGFSIEKGRLKNAKGDFVTLGDGAENASEDVKKLVKELEQLGYKVNSAGKITDLSGKFAKLGNDAENAGKDMDGMNGAVTKLNSTLGMLKGAFMGAMAFAGVGSVMQTADAMKTLDDQIKMATGSAEKHAFAMSEIERIAMANNVSLSSVGEMYVSNERALKQLGKSQEEVVKFTEQVTTAMRLGGGSAEGQAAALTQLGQALASGVLRGDEFNSIAEQAPMIMELMADSLNVSTGELRKMAAQGKLTADVVYDAMTSAGATEKLASMASQSSTTIGGALENVRTQWDLAVHGLMNSEGGISSIIAGGISLIADGLSKFGDYIPQINEYISGVISKAKELGTAFLESDAGKATIEGLKLAFEGLKSAVQGVSDVAESVTQFFRENPELAIALASGITAAATAYFVITGAMSLFATVSTAVATAGGLAAIATTALGTAVAFLTSPITLTVAAIGLLVAAGVYLYRNWDTIKAKASEIWNGIKETVSNAWESIKSFFSGDSFSGIWDGIKESASVAWVVIKNIVSVAWDNIKAYFAGSGDFLSSVWESVKSGVSGAWDSIKQAIVNKFNEIKQAFFDWLGGQPAPVQEMVSNIISIFTGLVGGIGAVWDLISSGASTAWEGIKSIASGAIDFISNAWNGIKDGASSAWESVKSTASGAFDTVKGYASEKLGQAKTVVSNIASDIGTAWDKAKDGASKAFDSVKSAISEKLNGAKDTAKSAMESVKSAIASSGIGDAFSKGFDSAKNAVSSSMNGIRTVVTAGITAVKAMIQLNVTTFAIVFNTVFNSIKTIVQTAFGVIKGIVTGDIGAVKSAIQNGLSQLAGIARNAITQMVSAFKSAGAQMRGVGGDIMQGLINGVKAKIGEFLSTIRNMASQGLATLRGVMRTASPSKATREIGEWVSEGLAIGIDDKAVMPIKSAKDTGQKVLEAYKNELEGLERDIYLNHLKAQGNPFAEFTADLKFGKKYQGLSKEELAVLEHKIKHKETSANIASYAEEIRNIDAETVKIGKGKLELMELEYETTRKYIGLSREDFELLKRKTVVLETRKFVEESTAKIKDQIATLGMNEFELLKHQLSTAKEYQAVTEETKNHHVETVKALKQQEALLKSQKDLERATTIAKNVGDKYAGMRYDLQQQGFDQSAIDGIVSNQEKADVATAFNDLRNQMGQTDDPFAKLEAENQRKLEIIQKARGLELAKQAEFDEMEKQQHAEFLRAKNELALTQGEQMLGSLTSIAKDAFGEQSKAYKVMFAMEKGMAIARSIMAIQTALASASASAPFPANLGVMATVAAQTASIIGNIKAVAMPVGQAHDGIMSVPKSGTWNLEKGERVLPKHTAKAMDDKLDSMGNGGVNITINIASDGNSQTDAQGANQTAKSMADKIKAVVLETLRQERKQGGLLYA